MRSLYYLIILLLGLISVSLYMFFKMTPISYVYIEMNPQIKLVLNRLDEVIDVISLNEEGHVLVADFFIDTNKLDYQLNRVIEDANALNMVDERIEVSIINNDEYKTLVIKEKVASMLEESLVSNNVSTTLIIKDNEDLIEITNEHDVSIKEAFYLKHFSLDSPLRKSALRDRYLLEVNRSKERILEDKGEHYFIVQKNSNYKRNFINAEELKEKPEINVVDTLNNTDEMLKSAVDDGLIGGIRSIIIRVSNFIR